MGRFTKNTRMRADALLSMWETTFTRNSNAGLGKPVYKPNTREYAYMCVKSSPNPAWICLGNVVSHMGICYIGFEAL
jgi:hypothetical protein